VHEYRQALRCVPGEYSHDSRLAAPSPPIPGTIPAPAIPATSGFPHQLDALPYGRRANGVPRQVSRHRGTAGDGPGQTQ